jgi:YidC/Oxa1 family membrane protein insertase
VDLRRLGATLMILAGGLILLALYANRHNQQRQASIAPATSSSTTAAAPAPDSAAPASSPAATQPAATAPASPPPSTAQAQVEKWFGTRAEGRIVTIGSYDDPNGYLFQVQLASTGSAVYTAKLTDYFATVQDKRLFEKDPRRYPDASAEDPAKYKGHYSVLNPVGPADAQVLSLALRRLTVQIEGDAPIELVLEDFDQKPWELLELTDDTARFAYVLYRGLNWEEAQSHPILRLVKTYSLRKGDYTIAVSLRLENLFSLPLKVSLDQLGPTGLPEDDSRGGKRRIAYGQYAGPDRKVKVIPRPAEVKEEEESGGWWSRVLKGISRTVGMQQAKTLKPGQREPVGTSDGSPSTLWIGTVNKYFGSMMYLVPKDPNRVDAPEWKARFYLEVARESGGSKTCTTGVSLPDLLLPPGSPAKEIAFEVFVGPKKRDLFSDGRAPHYRQAYEKLNYLGTIEFGSCCTWAPLTLGMMWLLGVLSHATLGNYGLAIIILVFLVRLVLHPLTKKSQVSMMKMQKLGPAVQKLKEKHGDDKAALNKEMMALYKQQGAMPLLGCLPMIPQMFIWVALFTALNVSVELRHAGFLPVWITDLSAPDAIFTWSAGYSLPLLGHTLNLLPILLTVAMFFQTKMTPTMSQPAATPDQARQQKMMQYMTPAMMLLFFYTAPSGLTLYIMASTFSQVIEQVVIRKHIEARQAAEAAIQTTVPLPGKTFRGQRPKKPKGPFWTKRG